MKSTNFKLLFYFIITVILTLGLSLSLQAVLAAWVGPTTAPPSANVTEPVNLGSSAQSKSGPLYVNMSAIASPGLLVLGNVGINTATPGATLHIAGGNVSSSIYETGFWFIPYSASINGNRHWRFDQSGNTSLSIQGYATNPAGATPDSVLLLQPAAGKVGIGTAAPNAKLTIGNNVYTAPLGSSYGQYQIMLFDTLDPASSYGIGVEGWNIGFNSAGGYKFYQGGGSTPLMVIGRQGSVNVGIGTPNPGYMLDVNGQINTTGGLCLPDGCKTAWSQVGGVSQWTPSGSDIYYNTGNVGVGITGPAAWAKLDVNGTLSVRGPIGALGTAVITSEAGGTGLTLKARGGDYPDLVVATNGNVGIGTAGPTNKLQVDGPGGFNYTDGALRLHMSNDNLYFYRPEENKFAIQALMDETTNPAWALSLQPNGGNVGIGTAGPLGKLNVYDSGTFNPATLSLKNIVIGDVSAANGWRATGICSGGSQTGNNVCFAANGGNWYWGWQQDASTMLTTMTLESTTGKVTASDFCTSGGKCLSTGSGASINYGACVDYTQFEGTAWLVCPSNYVVVGHYAQYGGVGPHAQNWGIRCCKLQ